MISTRVRGVPFAGALDLAHTPLPDLARAGDGASCVGPPARSSADHRPGQSLDEDHDDEERETEQNEGANGEDHLQGLVLEGSSGDQVAKLRDHSDGHVEGNNHCPELKRGRGVDPCGADEDRRGHDSHEPSEEDFLVGSQPDLAES